MTAADFPWLDDRDSGYAVEPYNPELDEAPAGSELDCAGDDREADGDR